MSEPYTVDDFLTEQSPIIGTDINQKVMELPTVWTSLVRQETWTDEVSNTQKTFQFDRVKLVDVSDENLDDTLVEEVEWANVSTDIVANDNTANHQGAPVTDGLPPEDNAEFTQTLRPYNLQHKSIWGPPMNTNQLRDKFVRVKQMGACVKALADQTREFWITRKRSEYARVSDQMVVLDSGFNLNGGGYGLEGHRAHTGTDASILTNGFTDMIYEYMNHQGAYRGALGMAQNRPVYALSCSPRTSRRLIHADPDVREDFRYSSENEKLLAPMGVKYNYNGFSHLVDEKTNRWEYDTGATATMAAAGTMTFTGLSHRLYKGSQVIVAGITYIVTKRNSESGEFDTVNSSGVTSVVVRRDDGTAPGTFTATAAVIWAYVPQFYVTDVNGVNKRVPNPNWLQATWEDSYVFHQGVCTSLVPKPITSVGAAKFDPCNYSGSYKWTKYLNRHNNPDGTIGQFRGVLSNGTRPDNPEFGVVIRHLACPSPDGRIMDCSSLG